VKIEGQASNSTLKALFFDVKRLILMVERLISEDCRSSVKFYLESALFQCEALDLNGRALDQ
jgi:hypothetical protein